MDHLASLLSDSIQYALEVAVPRKKHSAFAKPWWTKDNSQLRKAMSKALRRWKRSRSPEDWTEYKNARSQHFYEIKRSKENHWQAFLENAKGKAIWAAQKYLKPYQSHTSPPLSKSDGSLTTSHEEKCTILRQTLFPEQPTLRTDILQNNSLSSSSIEWQPLHLEELRASIFSSHPLKAPGPDGINFLCLQHTFNAIPTLLHSIFETYLSAGYHPQIWRQSTTVILKKPNKPDYSQPKAYRPIALLNTLGKTLEKIMAKRLSYMAESVLHMLPSQQCGGRPGRSALDAVMTLVHTILEGWRKGKDTTALLVDIKGAFDNVHHPTLLNILQQKGAPYQLITWTSSFLSHRSTTLLVDGRKDSLQPVQTGIPQGSPISPLLFLIYTSNLYPTISINHVKTLGFVDDITLYTQGNIQHNTHTLSKALQKCLRWTNEHHTSLDLGEKLGFIHFTRKLAPFPSLLLPDTSMKKPSTSVKLLGIHLDSKLTFNIHIQHASAKAERAALGLARLGRCNYGMTAAAIRQLYLACVAPVMDYGAPVWWTGKESHISKLKKAHSIGLRAILGTFRTTPISAMEIDSALLPLSIRLDTLCNRAALRLCTSTSYSNPVRSCLPPNFLSTRTRYPPLLSEPPEYRTWYDHSRNTKPWRTNIHCLLARASSALSQNLEQINPSLHPPWEPSLPHLNIHIQASTEIDKNQAMLHHQKLYTQLTSSSSNLIIYTDGSYLNGKAGCSYVVLYMEQWIMSRMFNLGAYNTEYDAELLAISKALESLSKLISSHNFINTFIFSDSASAIKNILIPSYKTGQQICTTARQAASSFLLQYPSNHLYLSWIPGHCSIQGNNKADILAKKATQLLYQHHKLSSISLSKKTIQDLSIKNWTVQWNEGTKGKSFRKIASHTPTLNLKALPTNSLLAQPPRRIMATVTQLRTGHAFLGSYYRRFVPSEPISCNCGAALQTREHILSTCPLYREDRYILRKASRTLDVKDLLGTTKGILAVAEFIKVTGAGYKSRINAGSIGWSGGMGDIRD
jgi:ribonuclease HI